MVDAGADVNAVVFRENGERVTALDIAEAYTGETSRPTTTSQQPPCVGWLEAVLRNTCPLRSPSAEGCWLAES